jgi:putative transposase
LRVQHARGRREVDEDLIFRTIAAQRALVDNAAREAAELRKARARRAHLSLPPALSSPEPVPGDEQPLALPYFPIEVWE